MPNSTKRNNDVSKLHPAIRQSVIDIQKKLNDEGIPLRVYEAFRTPELQREYTKRTPPITWVGPWGSIHQFGMAVDFVAFENGNWSWDTSKGREKWWLRMHELAAEKNMRPIRDKNGNLKELAHVQLKGVSAKEMRKGNYPDGGDHVWAEFLSEMIDNWSGSPAAPPKPPNLPERPPIPEDQRDEIEHDGGMAASALPGVLTAETDDRFRRFHVFIKEAEGGFANHRDDPGGPTNLGITKETLEAWRGHSVTTEDVKNLTQREADDIFRTNYYLECRCPELPDQVAMVVYNAAVMSGPAKAIRFLQETFNGLGMTVRNGADADSDPKPLVVDGKIGRNTLAAANRTDSAALSSAYLDTYLDYLRGLSHFKTFGRGWSNRIAKLREFVAHLGHHDGIDPERDMQVVKKTTPLDLGLDLDRDDLLRLLLAGATGGKSALAGVAIKELVESQAKEKLKDKLLDATDNDILKAIVADKLADDPPVPASVPLPVSKELTPVNAALGEGLGRLLNGRKTVIGILGLVATVILPKLGILEPDAQAWLTGTVGQIQDAAGGVSDRVAEVQAAAGNQATLLTLFSIFTGWGFLGKIEKAILRNT